MSVWTGGFLLSFVDYHPFNIYTFLQTQEFLTIFTSFCCQVSSQSEDYLQVPMSIIHTEEEDPLLIPESVHIPESSTLEARFWKGQVSGGRLALL